MKFLVQQLILWRRRNSRKKCYQFCMEFSIVTGSMPAEHRMSFSRTKCFHLVRRRWRMMSSPSSSSSPSRSHKLMTKIAVAVWTWKLITIPNSSSYLVTTNYNMLHHIRCYKNEDINCTQWYENLLLSLKLAKYELLLASFLVLISSMSPIYKLVVTLLPLLRKKD